MEHQINGKSIILKIRATNAGKFRFKKREKQLDFGEIFSTKEGCFDERTYLEWQIGYDVSVKDVESGEGKTSLDKKYFVGSSGKRKYPYELSELLYSATKIGLITKNDLARLLKDVRDCREFIDEKSISVERHAKLTINGVPFEEASIQLPTLFMVETPDHTQIEVSIQKQQYASGVQPMVYFCIPLSSFKNFSTILGKASSSTDTLSYVIDEPNVQNLIFLMKIFGMASKRHNHDVVQILNTLLAILA